MLSARRSISAHAEQRPRGVVKAAGAEAEVRSRREPRVVALCGARSRAPGFSGLPWRVRSCVFSKCLSVRVNISPVLTEIRLLLIHLTRLKNSKKE